MKDVIATIFGFLLIGLVTVLAIALFFSVFLVPAYYFDKMACQARWRDAYPTQYSLLGGCRVYADQRWWPEERFLGAKGVM